MIRSLFTNNYVPVDLIRHHYHLKQGKLRIMDHQVGFCATVKHTEHYNR